MAAVGAAVTALALAVPASHASSPDGKKIIFARNIGLGEAGFQVYVMNTDGAGVKQLSRGVDAHWASWGRHR